MKTIFFIVCAVLFSSLLFAQVNVYDTLESIPYFQDYLHHDKRENYYFNKRNKLVREYHFSDGALHYHRDFEDSLDKTLRLIYGKLYHGLIYVSEENVSWNISDKLYFRLRKGKEIDVRSLKRLFSSEADLKNYFHRAAWVKREEDIHFFYHQYFLEEPNLQIVYSFNSLIGKPSGEFKYNQDSLIINEAGFYSNGKQLYKYQNGALSIFDPKENKIFERTENEIIAYSNGRISWKYDVKFSVFTTGVIKPGANIDTLYFQALEKLWRENFSGW